MHSYARTNIQLFNQLRQEGYSNTDLRSVRDAYELAMVLFTGRFQPSGRPFVTHVVGTASILASLRLPAPVVAAGLLHNVYENGDFGDGHRGISRAKRKMLKSVLGEEAEAYVARFPVLPWYPQAIRQMRDNPEKLSPRDRNVVLIRLADHLEHLLDLDLLYYSDVGRRPYMTNGSAVVEMAEKLGLSWLAADLREAIRETEFAELPVELPTRERPNSGFVIVPRSCHKRFSVELRQALTSWVRSLHPGIRKVLRLFYAGPAKLVKRLSGRNGALSSDG